MTAVREQLVDQVQDPSVAFNQPANAIRPLQLQAAQELFAERVEQIPLVRRRADEAGITKITSFDQSRILHPTSLPTANN